MPKMPAGLSMDAKREWRRVGRSLYRMGLLTELDRMTLAVYCEIYARYERCQAVLSEQGDTYIRPNGEPKQRPEYFIVQNCLKELRSFIALFGLSPSARIRLQVEQPDKPDAMDKLLDQGGRNEPR